MYILSISEYTYLAFVYILMYILELLSLCNTCIKCRGNQQQATPDPKCGSMTVLFVTTARRNNLPGKLTIIGAITKHI